MCEVFPEFYLRSYAKPLKFVKGKGIFNWFDSVEEFMEFVLLENGCFYFWQDKMTFEKWKYIELKVKDR